MTLQTMEQLLRAILLKHSLRSDKFWTHPWVYGSFLKYIPLFLDTLALMKSQYWPRERIERLQAERLRMVFFDAVRVPFWRDVFARAGVNGSLSPQEILSRLPITSKKELADRPLEYIADTALLSKSDPDHTSGSTGRPFHFHFDWHASLRSFAVTERIFRTATGGKRFPIVYMRARPRNGFTFHRHHWFFLRGHHGVRHRMDEFKKLGERFPRGFVLYGYTSSVVEVVRQLQKLDMSLPITAALATGEGTRISDRTFVEETLGTAFHLAYASREAGFLGYECERHQLHLSEEWAYIEIVDDQGKPLPFGHEGRIIVTTFDNRVMPFIRYDLGDRGVISNAPCACGRTLRTITLRGRTAELIEVGEGRTVSLLDISSTIDQYWDSVRQFQIIQKGRLSFVIKMVPGPQFLKGREILEGKLIRLLHPNVEIRWDVVDEIPEAESGKAVYFVRELENNDTL